MRIPGEGTDQLINRRQEALKKIWRSVWAYAREQQ